MNNLWFISDTHFGHANILKYDAATRGHFQSIEEHDEFIIQEWNRLVKKGDTVYHLGDFSFKAKYNNLELARRLNGHIQLIMGNHDPSNIDLGYHIPQDVMMLKKEQLFLSHYPHYEWPSAYRGVTHLFGHVHESFLRVPGVEFPNINVGCNWHNFKPLHLDEIKALCPPKS